jgi:mannose-6-phosphate isomerase-like protein (cupin superfamily)
MFVRNISDAPQRRRAGLVSHILLQRGDVAGSNLAVTWVDVEPGDAQRPHSHAPEQVYVVVRGRGLMMVGTERRGVHVGDLVHVPPEAPHAIQNTGDEMLTYISAASPALDLESLYDTGELKA